jgi:multidrug efflux pump subunit AcrA (membrane-fusion protein)
MKEQTKLLLLSVCFILFFAKCGFAADKKQSEDEAKQQAPPPALVEVAQVTHGEAEPMVEFVGTVYFARKSEVAAEVDGIVEQVIFEE